MFVFIRPPSLATLEERLRARGTETDDSLSRRMETAKRELVYGEKEGNFDVVITNDDLDKAYAQLREFVLPEVRKVVPDA